MGRPAAHLAATGGRRRRDDHHRTLIQQEPPLLAIAGRRISPSAPPVSIGAASSCDVVVAGDGVQATHARLVHRGGTWVVESVDPGARLWIDGNEGDRATIDGPRRLALGSPDGPEVRVALVAPAPHAEPEPRRPEAPSRIRVGRSDDNDLVVPDLMVARYHAELRWDGYGWRLLDLASQPSTYVDGQLRGSGELHFGQRLTFGATSYRVGANGLEPVTAVGPDRGATPTLAARHLSVEVDGGTRILDDVSFSAWPGELVAIVGPSGSGKSTLLKALTGSRRPEHGTAQVRGLDLYDSYDELRRTIGYVPQDDILHHQLTIRQALLFGAELRFPADTTDQERRERVDEILAQLELTARADVPISSISGGQRKRVSVALELLTRPELLFLDEPTSGLDPGFERTVMELLRSLASAGRAVVVVTHSLQSLELCDRVVFLAPGGTIAFAGPPDRALEHFGRRDVIEVFRDLEARPRPRRPATGSPVPAAPAPTGAAPPPASPPDQPWGRQVSILARRQIAILRSDRQNLAFLLGSVLVPAVLILLLMGSDTLRLGQEDPVVARNILGAIVVAAVAIGAANAIREIVKELPIYLRERSVGLQRSAYLSSKLAVIGVLTTLQTFLLVAIATARAGGPSRANLLPLPRLELALDVAVTGLAAVALGLALSAVVSSSEKAMALVPVVFVVQWLFSGAALDLQAKPVMREVAMVTSANWGMAAAASTVDEHQLSQTCSDPPTYPEPTAPSDDEIDPFDPDAQRRQAEAQAEDRAEREKVDARREQAPTCDARWETGLAPWLTSIGALLLQAVVAMWAADRLLARREPLEAQRVNDWPLPGRAGPARPF